MKRSAFAIFLIWPCFVFGHTLVVETQYLPLQHEDRIALISTENRFAEQDQENQLQFFATITVLMFAMGLTLLFAYWDKLRTAQKIKELNAMESWFPMGGSHLHTANHHDREPDAGNVHRQATLVDHELPVLLVVDDNADIRSLLKDLFMSDYTVLEAANGVAALALAQNEIPDCIVSDVMMPKMDGFEFTKRIKNNELTSFIPVVMLTAKSTEDTHLESLECMADAFLTKPFHNEVLKETVARQIAGRQRLRERYSHELVLKPMDITINTTEEQFLEKIGTVMRERLADTGFSTDDFAAELGMSRMQLHRKLKSLLNVSTTEFIRNERLKSAVVLIEKGHKAVSEVAYAVGFNDVSYFSKCFKEVYGVTPTEYIDDICNQPVVR